MPAMIRGLGAPGAEGELEPFLFDECDADPGGGTCVQRVDDLP